MKTVNQFIEELKALTPELREKPIVITAANGIQFEATAKLGLEHPSDWTKVKNIVVCAS